MDLNQSKAKQLWLRRVKNYKAGFVPSDSNLSPESTLKDVIRFKRKNWTFNNGSYSRWNC